MEEISKKEVAVLAFLHGDNPLEDGRFAMVATNGETTRIVCDDLDYDVKMAGKDSLSYAIRFLEYRGYHLTDTADMDIFEI